MKLQHAIAATTASLLFAATVLPTFADTAGGNSATTTPLTNHKTVDLACMQTAVGTRDNAIISALDSSSLVVKTALQTRRDALKAAWGVADKKQRRVAIRSAWDAFRGTWKDAAKGLRTAKRDAWMQFNKDQRSCNGNAGDEPAGGQGVDAQL